MTPYRQSGDFRFELAHTRLLYHSPECIHRPSECVTDAPRRWLLRITRRRVNSAAFYEQTHEYHETDTHEQNGPPEFL